MLKLNSELRAQAREALQGNWVMAAVAALIYSAIVSATSYLPKKQANRRTTPFQKTGQLIDRCRFLYISMIQLRK